MHLQHLYRFMSFTTRLECALVNPIMAAIGQGDVPVSVSPADAADAYRIYVDEAYHGLAAADLVRDVARASSVTPAAAGEHIDVRVHRILDEVADARQRRLAWLLFVFVSETMISGTLACVPKDPEVVVAVREVVGDHAVDEGRHHAFFAGLLPVFWPQLSAADRVVLGPLIPRFIRAFTAVDRAGIERELVGYGMPKARVTAVLDDVCAPEQARTAARRTAASTLRYLAACGAFDDPAVVDAMVSVGLLS
jgi:hypothetical protein